MSRRRYQDQEPQTVSPSYFTAELNWSLQQKDTDTERESWKDAVETLRAGATRISDGLRLAHPPTGLAGNAPEAIKLTAADTKTHEEVTVGATRNRSHSTIIGLPALIKEIVQRGLDGRLQVPEILLAQAAYWSRSTPDPK